MSKTQGELTACLKELHLPTIRACYAELADSARGEQLSYEEYLLELMQRECQGRRENRVQRLLRESRLPLAKGLSAFDLKRLPGKVSAVVRTLVEGGFVDRRENVARRTCCAGSGRNWFVRAGRCSSVPRTSWFRTCCWPSGS